MQGVFQGNWGKVQNISRQPEDQQGATFIEHKLHEIPLEDECAASSGRLTIRPQGKFTYSISQQGGMQSSSSGQHGFRRSQSQRGAILAQHKLHDIPFRDCTRSSEQQTTRNQCDRTESSSQQNQKSHSASSQSGSSGQDCRREENRQPQETSSGNTQSCSSGSSSSKGNTPQDTCSQSQCSDR